MTSTPTAQSGPSAFRKRPVVIEAVQLARSNGEQLAEWCGGQWLSLYGRGDRGEDISHVAIRTLEGTMRAELGDWIIKGVAGEFYPCKPEIFAASYEPAKQPPSGARDAVADAAVSLRGLAGVIRKHGTCAPSALEVVAERLEALAGKADGETK